ncbi:MAG: hypothetical protein LH479_02140 [Polaromonas sp.]|nr:hypothetical protein [Polaromonas sp.]
MPGEPVRDSARRAVAGRWKMLLLLLVCVAPIAASYFSYYVLRPEGRRNFGELIDPQRPLPNLATRTLGGAAGDLRTLKGQWLLVTVAGGACDAVCENNLYLQRQLRESLGKEKERLDRVWLIVDEAPVPQPLSSALGGASVLRVSAKELAGWLKPQAGQALADHLYVVDPVGNWMMRFPPNLDAAAAAKAKRDLDRLLRASAGWDTEGRP